MRSREGSVESSISLSCHRLLNSIVAYIKNCFINKKKYIQHPVSRSFSFSIFFRTFMRVDRNAGKGRGIFVLPHARGVAAGNRAPKPKSVHPSVSAPSTNVRFFFTFDRPRRRRPAFRILHVHFIRSEWRAHDVATRCCAANV